MTRYEVEVRTRDGDGDGDGPGYVVAFLQFLAPVPSEPAEPPKTRHYAHEAHCNAPHPAGPEPCPPPLRPTPDGDGIVTVRMARDTAEYAFSALWRQVSELDHGNIHRAGFAGALKDISVALNEPEPDRTDAADAMRAQRDRLRKIVSDVATQLADAGYVAEGDAALGQALRGALDALRAARGDTQGVQPIVEMAPPREPHTKVGDTIKRGTDKVPADVKQFVDQRYLRVWSQHPANPTGTWGSAQPSVAWGERHLLDECAPLVVTAVEDAEPSGAQEAARGDTLPKPAQPVRRLRECVESWPEAETGGYDPRCCRFPKSCSATVYDKDTMAEEDLEPAPESEPVDVLDLVRQYGDERQRFGESEMGATPGVSLFAQIDAKVQRLRDRDALLTKWAKDYERQRDEALTEVDTWEKAWDRLSALLGVRAVQVVTEVERLRDERDSVLNNARDLRRMLDACRAGHDEARQAGWRDGVHWAAAEADAMAAQWEADDRKIYVADTTEHLRLCAGNPDRLTLINRKITHPEGK